MRVTTPRRQPEQTAGWSNGRISGRVGLAKPSRADLPRIISLFSGAGGLDLGFKQAGYSIAVAVDSADSAIRTHRKNFPRTKSFVADLVAIKPAGVLAYVRSAVAEGSRLGVIGGPPCQGF